MVSGLGKPKKSNNNIKIIIIVIDNEFNSYVKVDVLKCGIIILILYVAKLSQPNSTST